MTLERTALSNDPWLSGLPEAARAAMLKQIRVQTYRSGQAVFLEGDPPASFCCLLEGELEASTVTASGARHIVVHLFPIRWFGELSFLDGLPRTHDVKAQRESRIAEIPAAEIRRLLNAHDAIYKGLVANLCANTRLIYRYFNDFQKRSVETLTAISLLEILSSSGGAKIALSQQILADRIGATRQTINAVLSRWEDRGLIARSYRCVTVLDPEALGEIAAG